MPTGNKSRNRSILLERDEELNILWDIYFDFLNGYKLSGRNIIISGDEGVGKTHLAQYFFNEVSSDRQFLTLKVCCYKAQSRYIYKPIEMLMQQLATSEEFRKVDGNLVGRLTTTFPFLSFHGNANNASDEIATVNEVVIEKSLLELLKDLSKSKKMIIFLDDIQWADEATINLLQSIMLSEVSDNILFIMTLRSDLKNEAINQLLSMKNQLFMAFLPLEMFDYEKTYKIAKKLLPEHKFTEHDVEEFYTETYGNAFNIVETVNNIRITGKISGFTPNVKNVLENRLASFPKSYRQVIELIAMFYDGVSFMTLLSISKKEEYELLEILDDLLEQKIIKEEVILGKVLFMFTHPKMQEFVYSEISLSKKRFLHMKIGLMYESYLQNNYFDSTMYTKIMYHLSKSEDTVLFVKYAVKYMYSLLNTTHEFFPTLGSQNSVRLPENTENIESLLTDIMNAVESSPEVLSSPTSVESICEYYHIMARKFIRQGEYKQGLEYTEKLKRKAKELDPKLSYNYLLKAYNQEACSFINQYDLVKLEKVIEDSKNILSKVNNSNELFVWQRFEGLCLVMKNEYSLAKTVLSNSIDGFEESDEKEQYLFNLAAAYAWKGEAMRLTGDFDGAIESYLKSLKIYTEKNIASSICVFYMYIGRFYLQTKEYDKAYINAKYAVDYFLTTDLLWQRAISCAYYAYICTIVEEYDNILPALEQADIYKVKIGGEYEKAIVSWSKVMIYKALDNNNEIKNKIFSNYMEYEQNLEFASNMLKNYKCEFELELLGK